MKRILFSRSVLWMLVMGAVALVPQVAKAQGTWNLYVGRGKQRRGQAGRRIVAERGLDLGK